MELPQVGVGLPRCIHLQSKAMAVYGEGFAADPDFQNDVTDFTCLKTGRALGPDNGPVNFPQCCNAERACYEEY